MDPSALFKKVLKLLLIKIPVAFIALSLLWVLILKWVPVWVTPLMISRSIEYRNDKDFHSHKKWCNYEKISPELAKAVIASEDNLFAEHNGFDWKEIKKAIDDHKNNGKKLRGASTISQQTAKNVFTFCTATWARKGIETYYTLLIEWLWPKERILEVYLNSIEMGPAIYGAEAVAQQHFGKPATKLTRSECALIAATLPNPIRYSSKNPSNYMRRRQSAILKQMQHF